MLTALAANTWPARFTSAALARAAARKLPDFFHSFFTPFLLLLALSCDPEGSSSSGGSAPTKPKAWHVSTFAGSGADANRDGTGTAASFREPDAIVQNGDTLYVLSKDNGQIRTIDKNTAEVQTIVQGNGIGYVDGEGTVAQFNRPHDIAISGTTLYVADNGNNRIRTVAIGATAADTRVGTLAGGSTAGTTDAVGTAARFDGLSGVAISGTTLYVTDSNNDRIRTVDISSGSTRGTVGTLAGGRPGTTDGLGTAASFFKPFGIAVSPDGTTLYVTSATTHLIRSVDISSGRTRGTVQTLAGSAGRITSGFVDGAGTVAKFQQPFSLVASADTLYVADTGNQRIRAIEIASKRVRTIAGSTFGMKDGVGTDAKFFRPTGITLSKNTLYVVDNRNNRIRKLEYK